MLLLLTWHTWHTCVLARPLNVTLASRHCRWPSCLSVSSAWRVAFIETPPLQPKRLPPFIHNTHTDVWTGPESLSSSACWDLQLHTSRRVKVRLEKVTVTSVAHEHTISMDFCCNLHFPLWLDLFLHLFPSVRGDHQQQTDWAGHLHRRGIQDSSVRGAPQVLLPGGPPVRRGQEQQCLPRQGKSRCSAAPPKLLWHHIHPL